MDPTNQANVANGGSKRGLYVVIGILALIIVGFLLKDKLGFTRKVGIAGYDGEVTKKLDGSTTYESDYGTLNMGSNKLPSNWPSDVPVYTNATITTSMVLDPKYTGTTGSTVVFTTSDGVQTIADFYKRELLSMGWTVAGDGTTVGATTILSARKDNRVFSVAIMNGSKVNVTVSVSAIPNTK